MYLTDLSIQLLHIMLCIAICGGFAHFVSRKGAVALTRAAIQTKVPPIFFNIILFFLAIYLAKASYDYLGDLQNFYESREAYQFKKIAFYWSLGIPGAICFGFMGLFVNSQAYAEDYIKRRKERKKLRKSHNDKGLASVEDIKNALK